MSMADERDEVFFCIPVDVAGDTEEGRQRAERISAECWDAGAAGVEERNGEDGGLLLLIYAAHSVLNEVKLAAGIHADSIGEVQQLHAEDWSESWKQGLSAIEVSPRLVVRPSFAAFEPGPGQLELVVDPRQAFGTGGHASTLLALQWIDALAEGLGAGTRVLDVGTGTGVLALAARGLGAGQAVGLDIDPLAAHEAGHWARHNGLADGFQCFAGGLEALDCEPFDLIVANLLRRELMPLVSRIASLVATEGRLVLSGLLASEQESVEAAFRPLGLGILGVRSAEDGGEHWISLLMGRG
jgi:ribosomal protein L11 methyltransferase